MEEKKTSSLAFPPNSNASKQKAEQKEEPPKREAPKSVVKAQASVKKKGPFKRLMSKIFADDAEDIKTSIVSDTILPAIRGMLYDMGSGVLESLFGVSVTRTRSRYSSYSGINYGKISTDRRNRDREPERRYASTRPSGATNIFFETRDDAAAVLEGILDVIDTYEIASVADLYSLAGLPSEFTDNKFGWTQLDNRDIQIVRVHGGWELRLPKPYSLDQWL